MSSKINFRDLDFRLVQRGFRLEIPNNYRERIGLVEGSKIHVEVSETNDKKLILEFI